MAKIDELQEQLEAALGRISQLEGVAEQLKARNAQLEATPPSGGIGDALKELLGHLKSKDAQAADAHAEQKAKNHKKRVEIFNATKKNSTHVFYKLHAPAYLHGVEHAAGSIVSFPLKKDESGKVIVEHPEHLPSIHWKPVVDRIVTTELVGADEQIDERAADKDPAAA